MWSGLIPNHLNSHFVTKTVPFKFRGISLTFDLSQGLFSSAGIDSGTQLLLKIFSQVVVKDIAEKAPFRAIPQKVLDAGCGCGVIGICAAAALSALPGGQDGGLLVHCQDRDELARLFTLHNAAKNGISPLILEACTEPLLSTPPGWDLILTNIPAKAGTPVLEDFVRRSTGLLTPDGKVIMVAVNTLADFFRDAITANNTAPAKLLLEHTGPGHTVFVYGKTEDRAQAEITPNCTADFFTRYPFYARAEVTYPIEKVPIKLETIHGASGFDNPGGAVLAAAKLSATKIPREKLLTAIGNANGDAPLLVHEPDQGFFPCWLLEFLAGNDTPHYVQMVLSGRNILALEAARHNAARPDIVRMDIVRMDTHIVPAADLSLGSAALLEASGGLQYTLIAAFPELLPQSMLPRGADQLAALWDALPPLLAPGGIFLAAFSSSDAERFDRKKPAGFTRLGTVKRDGFRAMGYVRDYI